MTQARTRPPTFVIFGTRNDVLPASYHRYLVNGMRRELGFQGVPIRINFRNSRNRSEEHTSELQSLMRNSYAVFCLKKKKNQTYHQNDNQRSHKQQPTKT